MPAMRARRELVDLDAAARAMPPALGKLGITFHGVSPKHLQRYLDEFGFRFDRRWQEERLFSFVLNRTAQAPPFPYRQLTAARIG